MVSTIQHQLKQILDANRSDSSVQQQPQPKLPLRYTLIACALLVAIALAAYGRSLTTFFIADDFGEVAYVSRIANGDWNLFWSNWTGNYMQIPGMAVYRPFLLISLLTDYLLYKTNAVGYYATNLLFYVGDVLMLFLVARKVTQTWSAYRSLAVAFLGAALFAVSPLHCETVSWVVGRVDASCLLMSLASIYCFLQARDGNRVRWTAASVACFISGLFFKEMAIGVPVLATALALFLPKGSRKEIIPLWIATAAYFVLRYVALGTLNGGYTGAIGDGQANAWMLRWLDIHNYERLLLPFGVTLFNQNNPLAGSLKFLYASAITLAALKLFRREISPRYVLLLGAWLVSAAVPIYKLWGIGMDIEGARFVFFLTAPLCLLLPFILLSPTKKEDRALDALCAGVILALAGTCYKITQHTNANWVHAGREVRDVLKSCVQLAHAYPGRKIVVLGIPKVRAGAHMIYNGATLRTMLAPPFTQPAIQDRFLTFDPIFYGPDQYINADRFRATLKRNDVLGAFVWNSKEQRFDKVVASPATEPDYIEVTAAITDCPIPVKFIANLSNDESAPTAERIVDAKHNGEYVVRIPVSHYWHWFTEKHPSSPLITTNAPRYVEIKSSKLVTASQLRPRLAISKAAEDGSGVYLADATTTLNTACDVIPGARKLLIESTKPNYFFDQIPEAEQKNAVAQAITTDGTTFDGTLPAGFLPKHEYVEIRARALDEHNKPLGEYSEPAIIYLR
jgi:hypothetical protein